MNRLIGALVLDLAAFVWVMFVLISMLAARPFSDPVSMWLISMGLTSQPAIFLAELAVPMVLVGIGILVGYPPRARPLPDPTHYTERDFDH